MLDGNTISKVTKVVGQYAIKGPSKILVEEPSFYKVLGKTVQKMAAKAEPETGKFLRMQNAKGGRVLKAESVPTQQAIDNSFGINFARMDEVNKHGGFYDRSRVMDALFGFKHGTPIEHIQIKSVPTMEAIEKLNRVHLIEQLKEAEVLGQLTPGMLAKRKDVLAALNSPQETRAGLVLDNFSGKISQPPLWIGRSK